MATEFMDADHVTWAVEWKRTDGDPHGWLVFRSHLGERTASCRHHVGVSVLAGLNDPWLMEDLERCFRDSVPVPRLKKD